MSVAIVGFFVLGSVIFGAEHRAGWGGGWRKWVAVVTGLLMSSALVAPILGQWPSPWWFWAPAVGAVILHAQAYNLPGHGESMDMGTMEGTKWGDFKAMLIRYVAAAGMIAMLLFPFAGWLPFILVPFGALPAVGYLLAHRFAKSLQTEYGELVLGGVWYGSLGLVAGIKMAALY